MIVVDSAVWIDHHHKGIDQLGDLMALKAALMHPFVLGEIALGSLHDHREFIDFARDLPEAPMAEMPEVLNLIVNARLHGSGIGYVDAHLIAATMLVPGGALWTRDRRLRTVAERLGLSWQPAG
jgi:predicted nucleic acid-binding protein